MLSWLAPLFKRDPEAARLRAEAEAWRCALARPEVRIAAATTHLAPWKAGGISGAWGEDDLADALQITLGLNRELAVRAARDAFAEWGWGPTLDERISVLVRHLPAERLPPLVAHLWDRLALAENIGAAFDRAAWETEILRISRLMGLEAPYIGRDRRAVPDRPARATA